MSLMNANSLDVEHMKSRMPPVLPCLVAVLAGIGLNAWLPWSFGPRSLSLAAGTVLFVAMVETGPFRYTRNPAYLGFCLLQAAIGCFLDNAWILASIIPAVIAIQQIVVLREEAYLEEKFGEAYLRYKRKVRRWL